jgi:P27 family predicted phage terminase small subunit
MLHGDRPDRIPQGEPVPAAVPVVPPDGVVGAALEVWQRLAPDLERQGVLTHWDTEALGVYCQAVVFNHQARERLAADGIVVSGRYTDVKHAAWQVFRDSSELMLRSGARFGLTPSDRAGLATGTAEKQLPGQHLLTQ